MPQATWSLPTSSVWAHCLPGSCSSQVLWGLCPQQWCSLLSNTVVILLSHSGSSNCIVLADCPWLSMELIAMAGSMWMSIRTVSSAHFKTSLRNPISLRSGRACALLGVSRLSQQLFLPIAQAAQGCFQPWSPQIPLSLPRGAARSEAAAGLQCVSPADDGSESPRGAAFRV